MRRGKYVLLSALACGLSACRDPTEATVAITTDVPCADLQGVTITAGPARGADTDAWDVRTALCDSSGEIGAIVLLPSAGNESTFAVRVVGGRDFDASLCLPPAYAPEETAGLEAGAGCIVARRQLSFLPHTPLLLPIELRGDCVGKPCDPTTTCFRGNCVPADIDDPERCAQPGGCPLDGSSGGAGGGGACTPGQTQSCYSGPDGTSGLGACVDGTTTCAADGSFGPCVGEIVPGPQDCSTPNLDETCAGLVAECGTAEWQLFVDTTGNDNLTAVGVDGQGNVVVIGTIAGAWPVVGNTLSTSLSQQFAARLDASGSPLWVVPLSEDDGSVTDVVRGLAVGAAGDAYVSGTFVGNRTIAGVPLIGAASDIPSGFVAKLDPSGATKWVKTITGNVSSVTIATNDDGSVVAAGGSSDWVTCDGASAPIGGGEYGMFVLRLDDAGSVLDLRGYDGTTNVDVTALAMDASGSVLIGGRVRGIGDVDFGGGPLAGTLIGGGFVVRFDPSGVHAFSKVFDGPGTEIVLDVALTVGGDAIVAGETDGTVDFGGGALAPAGGLDAFVVILDAAGAHLDSRLFGGAGQDLAANVVADPAGGFLLSGFYTGDVTFGGAPLQGTTGAQVFVASFDAQGAHRWSRPIHAMALSPNGLATGPFGPVAAGGYTGPFDAGLGVVASKGSNGFDGYVLKLAP